MYSEFYFVVFFTTFISVNIFPNFAQSTLYDYRGIDGTGTATNPMSNKTSTNYVGYVVRKLADGNCWMSENLKLTLVQNRTYEVANFDGTTQNLNFVNTGAANAHNVVLNGNTVANTNDGNWYYNWYAATAGQGTYTVNPTITRSICPKGWRLPTGDTAHYSFYLLINNYNIEDTLAGATAVMNPPISFQPLGYYNAGASIDYYGQRGAYWSATPNPDRITHSIGFGFGIIPTYVSTTSNGAIALGLSTRCLAI